MELDKLQNPTTKLLPTWFDIAQLNKLHTSQVGWWDKTHKKCQIGGLGNATHVVRFSCDANGRLDLEERTSDETEVTRLLSSCQGLARYGYLLPLWWPLGDFRQRRDSNIDKCESEWT